MNIQENHPLLHLNTFHVKASCRWFAEVATSEDLLLIIEDPRFQDTQKLILGGGSNILLTQDFDGLVIKNNFKGIEKVHEDENEMHFRVGAGENWHQFVLSTVEAGLGGVENLSLIPGNVGASPMQNIGAYGFEVKDVIRQVEAIDMQNGRSLQFEASDCEFGYRTSIFKTSLKNKVCITHVTFRLQKNPKVNTSYGAIAQELDAMGIQHPGIKDVSQAVIRIRQSKLPDPALLGNAGSFFKNPVIPENQAFDLRTKHEDLPIYDAEPGMKKIPAGWLIEKAGWKGRRIQDYGVHSKQALVLVNFGQATGNQIIQLANDITSDIEKRFGITLEKEVNIL